MGLSISGVVYLIWLRDGHFLKGELGVDRGVGVEWLISRGCGLEEQSSLDTFSAWKLGISIVELLWA